MKVGLLCTNYTMNCQIHGRWTRTGWYNYLRRK